MDILPEMLKRFLVRIGGDCSGVAALAGACEGCNLDVGENLVIALAETVFVAFLKGGSLVLPLAHFQRVKRADTCCASKPGELLLDNQGLDHFKKSLETVSFLL